MNKPLIGIVASFYVNRDNEPLSTQAVSRDYVRGILKAGGMPIIIPVQEKSCMFDRYAEMIDGLLLTGGGDITPSIYGAEKHEKTGFTDINRDVIEIELTKKMLEAGKSVFGICRGMQVINVYFGGTLFQHLPVSFRHARKVNEPDKVHRCAARPENWLSLLYGTDFYLNSAHHQAVDKAGEGLVIDAWCPEDGTAEAMHHNSLPIYAVQWHPERTCLAWKRNDTVNGLETIKFFCRITGGIPDEPKEIVSGIMIHGMGL